jgi:hypothetical protein
MKKDGIMKHLFKPQVVKGLWVLLILLLVIKFVWFLVEILWLPTSGMDHTEEKSAKALYYRVKLSPNKAPAPTVEKKPAQVVGSIKDITLLAIYNASDITVITVKYKRFLLLVLPSRHLHLLKQQVKLLMQVIIRSSINLYLTIMLKIWMISIKISVLLK